MKKIFFYFAPTQKTAVTVIAVLLLFLAGFISGWFGRNWLHQGTPIKEMRLGGYDFINPLLECDPGGNVIADTLVPFQYKVQTLVDRQKEKNLADHVSVYFRELNEGLSFSIDANEKFAPASLVKIPLLIAYLKWAEAEPLLLKSRLRFNLEDQTARQHIEPAYRLEPGKSYLIEDLLYRMIVYSDNNAFFLLYANVKPAIFRKVYTDLGLEVPKVRGPYDYVSVSEYASFFRILFNASYLNRESSQKALYYMSDTAFKRGLVGGVPHAVAVAHKFGEMTLGASQEIKQLHDCGIVYYPGNPYLLCIMSRGESFEHLDSTIQQVSHLVFEEVDRQHGSRN